MHEKLENVTYRYLRSCLAEKMYPLRLEFARFTIRTLCEDNFNICAPVISRIF